MDTLDLSRRTALREGALVLTVLACVPYLVLKTAWIFGSHLGIPDDSDLLDHEGTMRFANGLTFLMDAAALTLAFALARSWGRRIPAWLVAVPMWIATGLLAPIVLAFPLQFFVGAVKGTPDAPADFVDPWVLTVVYGGFCLQALGLAVLLGVHAIDRWGRLWRGTVAQLPAASPASRLSVAGAAIIALLPLAAHLLWASGSRWLGPELGTDAQTLGVHGVNAGLLLLAFAGTALLVWGRAGGVDARVPVVAAWIGSSAVAAWGAWMLLGSFLTGPTAEDSANARLVAVFALSMVAGAMLLVTGAHLLANWASVRSPRPQGGQSEDAVDC